MGTGLAINVITKSGGNTFKGTAGYAYQPLDWNGDNTSAQDGVRLDGAAGRVLDLPEQRRARPPAARPCRPTSGSSTASFGGPIMRDQIWFFGSFRESARRDRGSAAPQKNVTTSRRFYPDAELFPQQIKGYQPYVKVTARLGAGHELSGFFQRDRTHGQSNWEYFFDPINVYSNGGNVYSAKLTSVWGQKLTTTFSAGYNNKSGNDNDTYDAFGFDATGPEHRSSTTARGSRAASSRATTSSSRAATSIRPRPSCPRRSI